MRGSVGDSGEAGISFGFAEVADFGPLGRCSILSGDATSVLPSEIPKCPMAEMGQEETSVQVVTMSLLHVRCLVD